MLMLSFQVLFHCTSIILRHDRNSYVENQANLEQYYVLDQPVQYHKKTEMTLY